MHLLLCIGFLERRDGPFLGLRPFVEQTLLPQFPHLRPQYFSYHDDLVTAIRQTHSPTPARIILLGQSYGAAALVRATHRLPEIPIAHLILLDPVPRWAWGQFQWSAFHLPPAIRRATNIRNPIGLPIPAPIRSAACPYRNLHSFRFHPNIPADAKVQRHILQILTQESAAPAHEPHTAG